MRTYDMLSVEFLGIRLRESDHLELVDEKARLLDSVENFANIRVSVRFDHGEGANLNSKEKDTVSVGLRSSCE